MALGGQDVDIDLDGILTAGLDECV